MRKQHVFTIAAVLLGIIAFRHVWTWLPAHSYQAMLSHGDLLAAIDSADNKQVATLAERYHYQYQAFKDGRLLAVRGTHLPAVQLVRQPLAKGVIGGSLQQNLATAQPYQMRQGLTRYVFFAASPARNHSLTYIIYGQVL